MPNIKDKEHYELHWEHTSHLYQELSDYLRFMVAEDYLQKSTYEMMMKAVSEMFEQYKDLYNDIVDE